MRVFLGAFLGLVGVAFAVEIGVKQPDAFYDPPTSLPKMPGVLLRSEPLKEVYLPLGMTGWRILYSTTINDSTPAIAVATVFAPAVLPAGPRPVITWLHGTTGLVQRCMPSLISHPTEGIPARDHLVKAGLVVIATDYSFTEKDGPHPYLIGDAEARAGLDAFRAARQMPELMLGSETVVWGHSQGGHSSLWTGIIGPRYAPDVKILGVAAIAPAADVKDIMEKNEAVNKRLGPYIAGSYSRFYPDVSFERALRPEALDAANEIIHLCGFFPPEDPKRMAELLSAFEGPSLSQDPALVARLTENTANRPISAPLLITQGLTDAVVLPEITHRYVKERCDAKQRLEYYTFENHDHGAIVRPGSVMEDPLVEWTMARLQAVPQPEGCHLKAFKGEKVDTLKIYKILTEPQWNEFRTQGTFSGSPVDIKDGYIHFSSKEQVEGVIARYYAGQRPIYIVEFSATTFGTSLRWEQGSTGEKFPHVYGQPLLFKDVLQWVVRQ